MIGPQVISKGTMDSLEEASAYFKKGFTRALRQ